MMTLPTRADTFLIRRGEQINVYRKTAAGNDEFNRPEYTWALKYSLGIYARFDRIKRGEEIYLAGEKVEADYLVLLQSSADVLKDDELLWHGERWDVKAIDSIYVSGLGQFQRAFVKRLIE